MPEKILKIKKMKIFYSPEMLDQPFPEKQSYLLLVEKPEELKDINEVEGTKLGNALDKTIDTSDDLPQGTTNKYLLDLSVTKFKLAAAAVEWEKIANDAVRANNIWTGGNVITLSAQIKEAIILNAHIQDATILAAKIGSLNANVINTGILTGRTVRTSSAGYQVVLETGGEWADSLLFYYSNVLEGRIYAAADILTVQGGAGASGALFLGTKSYPLLMRLMNSGVNVYRNITMSSGITVDGVDISAFKTSYNALAVDFIDHIVGNPSAHHIKTGLDNTPVNGQTAEGITSNWAYDHSVSVSAHHDKYSSGLAITPYSVSATQMIYAAGVLKGADCIPKTNDTGQVGYGNQHWDYIRGNYLLYDISCDPFQDHDDIQLIKNIKIGKEKGIKVWRKDTFPKEVFRGKMFNTASVNSLLIGTLKQLVERVENLEKKIL